MIIVLQNLLAYLTKSEKGQNLTEYSLLVVFIAIIVVLAVLFFGQNISASISSLGSAVNSSLNP